MTYHKVASDVKRILGSDKTTDRVVEFWIDKMAEWDKQDYKVLMGEQIVAPTVEAIIVLDEVLQEDLT